MTHFTFTLLAFAIGVIVGIVVMFDNGTSHHTCTAPCVVTFDAPMYEDEFDLDYRGDGTVRVWRIDNP